MSYIETISGMRVFLPGVEKDQIILSDIRHALERAPRFAGHTNVPYSVLQHSVSVAKFLEEMGCSSEIVLQGLMHDATEAYLCDIPTPFKRILENYDVLEKELWDAISGKFGVLNSMTEEVKYADRVMLHVEKNIFKPKSGVWPDEPEKESMLLGEKVTRQSLRSTTPFLFDRLFKKHGGNDVV